MFFWRWAKEYQQEALFGVPPAFDGEPPSYFDPQPPYTDEDTRAKVKEKVSKVLKNNYMTLCRPDEIRSLMFMFDVPKGDVMQYAH
jgi:hypothetical protein